MALQDLVGQALNNAADVLTARYNARAGGTAAVQDASLSSVDRQNDIQARAGSYVIGGASGFPWVPALIAVAALAVIVLVARK